VKLFFYRPHDVMKYIRIICIFIFFPLSIILGQTPVTATEYFIMADSIADTMLEKPRLLEISADSLDIDGKSIQWIFKFDSLMLTINEDTVITDTSFHGVTGYALIEGHWMDSDSAMIIAEKEGGTEFRRNHGNSIIMAWLTHASGSPRTEWGIEYHSIINPQVIFQIWFDASDGSNIYTYNSAVEFESDLHGFQLHQNFPNPFNEKTNIYYSIPNHSRVKIAIYNLEGKEIEVLLNHYNPAGNYHVEFYGEPYTSGIYFVRLMAGQYIKTKKIILQK